MPTYDPAELILEIIKEFMDEKGYAPTNFDLLRIYRDRYGVIEQGDWQRVCRGLLEGGRVVAREIEYGVVVLRPGRTDDNGGE